MNKILLFKLSTCSPCKLLSKLFTQLHILKEDIVLDEDENEELADKYNIKSVPTIIVLNNEGEELGRFVGPRTKEQLLEELKNYEVQSSEKDNL